MIVMALEFTPTTQSLPQEGIWCETMDSTGRITRLRREGSRWFNVRGVAVLYTPNHWRYLRYDDDH